jgi:hypothetical protein
MSAFPAQPGAPQDTLTVHPDWHRQAATATLLAGTGRQGTIFPVAPLRYSLVGLGGSQVTACAGRRKTASMTLPPRAEQTTGPGLLRRLLEAMSGGWVDPALAGPSLASLLGPLILPGSD